ncbi:putative membrane protein YkvI [Alkalibacillus flavidus]|uniref:Membrane protein YkvI n=1 Tax=Alkalibacillus flavidus TaxID=546021 RepID=A0ABV2KXJ2_9BACI
MMKGFKWIGLIVATMIGAGYASGREIWEFFGHDSSFAIILFAILFTISCHVILSLSYELKSDDYMPLLRRLLGDNWAKLYDWSILLYLFSTIFVMISGSGATVAVFEWPPVIGIALMVIGLLIVVPKGMDGILSVNRLLLPLMVVALSLVLILFVWREHIPLWGYDMGGQGNWMASIPFTSLNVLPLIAVLGAVGKNIKQPQEIYVASIGSGLILGVISYLYNMSLVQVADQLYFYDVPLFAILYGYRIEIFFGMAGLLIFAIYTTALTSLFGLIARIQSYFPLTEGKLGLALIVLALPFTLVGFSDLISYLYPLYGVINLYVLAMLLLFPLTKRANQFKT